MIKNIILLSAILFVVGCTQTPNGNVTPTGYTYTHSKIGTEKAKPGDFAYFTFKVEGSDGTVLQDLGEGPSMPVLQIPTADKPLPTPNPVIEMLANGSVGDTMVLHMPIDSVPNAKGNPNLAAMEYLSYITVLKDLKSEVEHKTFLEEQRLEMEAKMEEDKKREPIIDELVQKTLKSYKSKKLDLKDGPEGLKYVIHEEGQGKQVEEGMRASVHYYGVTMEGEMFDNSFKMGRPYPFTVGGRAVIRGWDIGMPLFKVGTKATIFLPYTLAYGEAGSPPRIGPKSDLVFYVEIADAN